MFISIFYTFAFDNLNRDMIQKTQIEECVFRMISENGIKAVSMDKIAAELKVSKQSIYSYFPSKKELIHNCIKSNFDIYMSKIERIIKLMPNPLTALVFVAVDSLIFFSKLSNKFMEDLKELDDLKDYFADVKKESDEIGKNFITECYEGKYLKSLYSAKKLSDEFRESLLCSNEYKSCGSFSKKLAFEVVTNLLYENATFKGREILNELKENYA